MVCSERSSGTSVPKKEPQSRRKRKSRPQGLPSPALCCACGLCIMLAGINITLVGAFAFTTLMPSGNPPIIIGPILLLVAFTFFGACCVCSRLPPPQGSRRSKGGRGAGLGSGTAAFEIETSEHTMQDTTAVQLSPTNSPSGSSHGSGVEQEANANANSSMAANYNTPSRSCKLFTMETNGPNSVSVSASATFSSSTGGGGAVRLTLPSDSMAT
ncbi:transmembrane protein 275 [Astyanax mexicanus]|uniref:Transmembrane protein 275 n=1 Tax=Astyanax mexicanus TaxID=7994 RepID=A0A8T2M3F8_ASTMX|nr:transmembrane protein 275 [Astyanax mexicanus]